MKKALRILSLIGLAGSMFAISACGNDSDAMKVGFICIGSEDATYDKNFMDAMDAVAEKENCQVLYKKEVSEMDATAAYDAAVELAEAGCKLVIADSFGFEANIVKAAEEHSDVLFVHCTGVQAHTKQLPNYVNAFASIYEGRYLAGVAAGMKLQELGKTKLGYVGAFPYAEVISGYTAFYLGAKSIVSNVTMDVQYTNNWGDAELESAAATNLISKGAAIVSQHADTYGAPNVCNTKGVPNVSYNVSTNSVFPDTYLCSSRIDWSAYFELAVKAVKNGERLDYDYTSSLADGGVVVGELGRCAPNGTAEALATAKAELLNGTRHVFDTSTFTVTVTEDKNTQATVDENGHLTRCLADTDGDYAPDTNVVENGVYWESKDSIRSAPYFDVIVDGINIL